jgi:hypothetical protein
MAFGSAEVLLSQSSPGDLPVTLEQEIERQEAALLGPATARASNAALRYLYVVGGQQRSLQPIRAQFGDWYEYQKAVVIRVDTVTGQAEAVLEYISPQDACPDEDPAILFKSGTLVGDRLYVSTQTEVLVYRVPTFELESRVSLPFFNDVHHVRPTPTGNLLVAITGLDMVAEITLDGETVNEWNVLDLAANPFGDRFSRRVDYRKIPSTKPHLAHPNHVFYIGTEPWATRFQQQDAISLLEPSRRIAIGVERLHDGVVYGDKVLFTAVNGRLVIADTNRLEVDEIIDLHAMHRSDVLLGWCRSLLLDDSRVWIGFTRMRPTRFRENVAWLKNGFRHYLGTHIALYDLMDRRCLAQIDTSEHGIDAIFGIFPSGAETL